MRAGFPTEAPGGMRDAFENHGNHREAADLCVEKLKGGFDRDDAVEIAGVDLIDPARVDLGQNDLQMGAAVAFFVVEFLARARTHLPLFGGVV
ncbi:MAG: hypothetical protein D6690_17955 [Nitrospirae bacterium]|nr:MAG: hypothetical protein D6690_17955 [Nitrospirota bacterium]